MKQSEQLQKSNTRPLKEATNKQMLRPGGMDKPVKRDLAQQLGSKTIKKDDAK